MLEILRQVGGMLVTVFVLTSMFNVGLTQQPSRILHHLKNWHFLGAMVLTNLIVVPALMVFALDIFPIVEHYRVGLLIFGIAAGAPFLIKLTDTSQHELALGATVLMVLMVATVVVMPVLLPALLDGVEVAAWPIISALLQQMIAPLILGFVLSEFAESLDAVIQPWVARISNIALYGLIVCILIGYAQSLLDPELWKALLVGGVVLILAFFVGFMMGDGTDRLKDVGGLGTAQRGTASALIVATSSFSDSRILVVITILNTVGIVFLILAAKQLSKDNEFSPLDDPMIADEPLTRAERMAEREGTRTGRHRGLHRRRRGPTPAHRRKRVRPSGPTHRTSPLTGTPTTPSPPGDDHDHSSPQRPDPLHGPVGHAHGPARRRRAAYPAPPGVPRCDAGSSVLHRGDLHALALDHVDRSARQGAGHVGQHELPVDQLPGPGHAHRRHDDARAGLLHGVQGQVAPVGRAAAARGGPGALRVLGLPAVG